MAVLGEHLNYNTDSDHDTTYIIYYANPTHKYFLRSKYFDDVVQLHGPIDNSLGSRQEVFRKKMLWTLAWNTPVYLFVINASQNPIFYTASCILLQYNYIIVLTSTFSRSLESPEEHSSATVNIDSRGENIWIGKTGKGIDVALSQSETLEEVLSREQMLSKHWQLW